MDSSSDTALHHAAPSGANEAIKALLTLIAAAACAYGLFAAPPPLKILAALGLLSAPSWLATSRNRSACRAGLVVLAADCYVLLFWVSAQLVPAFLHH